jgi:predicted RNA binding protein YcfA (HicA-like mRNA interferase family)
MKCSELLRLLKADGWLVHSQKGSHKKLKHPTKEGTITFPDHGNKELAKGTEKAIRKQAGLR